MAQRTRANDIYIYYGLNCLPLENVISFVHMESVNFQTIATRSRLTLNKRLESGLSRRSSLSAVVTHIFTLKS